MNQDDGSSPGQTYILEDRLRIRVEFFGSHLWRPKEDEIFRLDLLPTAIAHFHLHPRVLGLTTLYERIACQLFRTTTGKWRKVQERLIADGLLVPYFGAPSEERDIAEDMRFVAAYLKETTPVHQIAKPFWAHLQPFTLCNQQCLHCYCNGSPSASPLILTVQEWRDIIGVLDEYGVHDVYITGGETLAIPQFFELAKAILDRGLGFGLSTNATTITDTTLKRLSDLGIGRVQVSLDGGFSETHDRIRGMVGAFEKTLRGIELLSSICEPVVNSVVNSSNIQEMEEIVRKTSQLGCRSYKFFPQKPVGRARHNPDSLEDDVIKSTLIPLCRELSSRYAVSIESIDPTRPCGSGTSGFAVNEAGDVYPCIFGILNHKLRCGNLLRDGIDKLWFESEVLREFRSPPGFVCRRCE